eukprot:5326228-Amphidinium_carterae.1
MHLVALDAPDADGYNIYRFMTFNPCISYTHMKKLAGSVKQVVFGNGRKSKRIAAHAYLTHLGGTQLSLSTHTVRDAATGQTDTQPMEIVGDNFRPAEKQKQIPLTKDQIKSGFDLI